MRDINVVFDRPLERDGLSDDELIRHYRQLDLSSIDHILALGSKWLRYFERVPEACGRMLMERCRGVVCQLHAHMTQEPASCHCTLAMLKDGQQNAHSRYVGWGADPELLMPNQDPDELRILVDHADYATGGWRYDITGRVMVECLDFAESELWRERFRSIRLRRFVNGGFDDFDRDSDMSEYVRIGVPYPEAAAEYRAAHLYMVTHRECVGMSVVETAMAGALPVVPFAGPAGPHKLFVPRDRLQTVRHVVYSTSYVPWGGLLNTIDVEASRRVALKNSWAAMVDKMLRAIGAVAKAEGRVFW